MLAPLTARLSMNIAHWLERAGRAHPQRPALMRGAGVMSVYGRFARRSAALASGLARLGLKPGERVAIAAHNCPEYLEVLFVAWWGGYAIVPVNAKLHAAEIGWILAHSVARAVFASADLAGMLA